VGCTSASARHLLGRQLAPVHRLGQRRLDARLALRRRLGANVLQHHRNAALRGHQRSGTGYAVQQATRPQTLAYGLTDSPAGQAAWILEKLWA
jgi:hypothetical protein